MATWRGWFGAVADFGDDFQKEFGLTDRQMSFCRYVFAGIVVLGIALFGILFYYQPFIPK